MFTEKPENLTVYPCPPGYCRCFQNLCTVGDEICNYAYFNDDPDKQCNCDREGEYRSYPYVYLTICVSFRLLVW